MTPAAPITLNTIARSIEDLASVFHDFATMMTGEITSIRTDLNELRNEVRVLQRDMTDVKDRVYYIEGELQAHNSDIQELYILVAR